MTEKFTFFLKFIHAHIHMTNKRSQYTIALKKFSLLFFILKNQCSDHEVTEIEMRLKKVNIFTVVVTSTSHHRLGKVSKVRRMTMMMMMFI